MCCLDLKQPKCVCATASSATAVYRSTATGILTILIMVSNLCLRWVAFLYMTPNIWTDECISVPESADPLMCICDLLSVFSFVIMEETNITYTGAFHKALYDTSLPGLPTKDIAWLPPRGSLPPHLV